MTATSTPRPREVAARLERELLAQLGLAKDANAQEIEAAHDELVEFLERAPHGLQGWARRQIAAADEAYALLSGATATRAGVVATRAGAAAADAGSDDEYFEELEVEPPTTKRGRLEAQRRARAAAQAAVAVPSRASARDRFLKRLAIGTVGVVAAVAIGVGVYNMGTSSVPGLSGTPAPDASGGPALDQARVAALMQKISANPKDIASLQALGDLYFQAGDYRTAADWAKKILAIDPKNITALLALGAADFNRGDSADAEKQWRAVLAIDDKNIEAHYDLGFMYLSNNPQDVANARLEWDKVIAIAPNSDVAKTVATHLQSLAGPPGPSAGGAATSPAPSRAPSETPSPVPTTAPPPTPSASR